MHNLKQTIYATIQKVIEELSLDVETLHDQDALVDGLGLKSLDLARIIATLDLKLDADPFSELVSITSVRTVGDLYAAYATYFSAQRDSDIESSTPSAMAVSESTAPQTRQQALRGV